MLQLLEHQDARAAGDDEAVAARVIGATGHCGRRVEVAAHGTHSVEHDTERPVQFLDTAGKDDVLLAHQDLLIADADAVGRGGAGRGDREVQTLYLEPGRQRRRRARTHGLWHREGAHAFGSAFPRRGGGFDDYSGRGPAGTDDQAGALVGDLGLFQAGVCDGLFHGDVAIAGALGEKAGGAAVDQGLPVDLRRRVNLGPEAKLGVFRRGDNAGSGLTERRQHLVGVVADGRDDTQSGDDDAAHVAFHDPQGFLRPLIQSDAEVLRRIDGFSVGFQNPVADTHDQTTVNHPLHLDLVCHFLDIRRHFTAKFDLAATQGATTTLAADPAEIESQGH